MFRAADSLPLQLLDILAPEYETVVFALRPGHYSDIFRTGSASTSRKLCLSSPRGQRGLTRSKPISGGYQRKKPVVRPMLGPWLGLIDQILLEDESQPKKQRHTAKRIWDRLEAEHAFGGGYTVVKDYVREARLRQIGCAPGENSD